VHIRHLQFDRWTTPVSDSSFYLPKYIADQCRRLVTQASDAFMATASEQTAAEQRFKAPSPLVRLDATITTSAGSSVQLTLDHDGHFRLEENDLVVKPFELEERPGGIGLTTFVNRQASESLGKLLRCWPPIWVVLGNDLSNEDHLWLGGDRVIKYPHLPPEDNAYVIVRAEPEDRRYHHLAERSLMSVTTKGRKDYGARLEWWRPIHTLAEVDEELERLEESGLDPIIVLKPYQGSKTNGVVIHAKYRRDKRQGMATRQKMVGTLAFYLERDGFMYLQQWNPPMEHDGEHLILRILFGKADRYSEWQWVGGLYNCRKEVLVHGARNTTVGPVMLLDE
jgi:hypothetical protein